MIIGRELPVDAVMERLRMEPEERQRLAAAAYVAGDALAPDPERPRRSARDVAVVAGLVGLLALDAWLALRVLAWLP